MTTNSTTPTATTPNIITKDTIRCISLAARPSNHGVRFHNWLYRHLGLDYVYLAIAPTSITAAVDGIRGLNIRGAGVSMPYKTDVLSLVDDIHHSAARINAANTIVNTDGHLTAYNTDYTAVATLAADLDPTLHVLLRGNGGMAKAVTAALADHGFTGTIISRNHTAGQTLAHTYGWDWAHQNILTTPDGTALVTQRPTMLVNVTPLGMHGDNHTTQSFPDTMIAHAAHIFDVVAYPIHTPLINAAHRHNIPTTNGGHVIALQAAEQFALYTGITPTSEQIEAAENYANQQ